eukprot:m.294682 g.294682  ORF g.294682 m.294682 type:complete len:370 (+) comp48585_c0_seq1:250-1359(+)
MPSTINVQGQVQASIPHIPRFDDAAAAPFRIQSAFYEPDDPRAQGHILPGTADNVQLMIFDIHRVLRHIDNPIYRSLQTSIEHVQALRDNGEPISHFHIQPHETGNYIYSTEITQASAGQIVDGAMIGQELGTARILQTRLHQLPAANNDDVFQLSANLPPDHPAYWPDANNNPTVGNFGLNQAANTEIKFDNPNWFGCTYPVLNPHGWPGCSNNHVEFSPTSGEFTTKRLTPMKFYRYWFQERSRPGSNIGNPLLRGGMVSKQMACDVTSSILYGRCEAYTKVMQRGMTTTQAALAAQVFGNADNAGVKLPPIQGTPAFMQRSKQNALSFFLAEHGADLLLTMTYNPNAEELDEVGLQAPCPSLWQHP